MRECERKRKCVQKLLQKYTQIRTYTFTYANTRNTEKQRKRDRMNDFHIYFIPHTFHIYLQAYPFADLFSSFGGFSVPHNSELNPIIKENQISALKTDVKVPQVEKLNPETMVKLFEWQTKSRAKLKAHPSIELRAAFMCDGIEIPILVIDGNETAFIRRSTDQSTNDLNWSNYPKVSDIGVKTRFGYRQTLGDVLSEVSRSKPNGTPLQYRPAGSLIQGGESVNKPPMVENVDNNLIMQENNDEQFPVNRPCTNRLCNEQSIFERPSFPLFNVQFFQ